MAKLPDQEEEWRKVIDRLKKLQKQENLTLAETREMDALIEKQGTLRSGLGKEDRSAAKLERGAAGAERKAAKSEQSAAEEERRAAKAEESFLKKLLNKNVTGERTDTAAAPWVSAAIIIIGLAEYLLRISGGELSAFVYGLSLLLFLLSGLAVAHYAQKDKITILIPMLLFVVWYFFFNGNYNPGFLFSFIPIAAGILVIPMVFSKGESIAPELLGLVPVLFFFLDIGLIPFLVENIKLPVTPLLQNLILFMPWWVLLGIFTFPSGASKSTSLNALLGFMRIIGIIYILFIIIAPIVPGLGYEKSLLPESGELEAAQQRLRAGIPLRENPAYSNLWCILFSEDKANTQACVAQRQENSELIYICEKVEQKEKGTPPFTQCLEEQRKKKKDAALQVQGAIDPTIKEPTKAEIVANKESFPTTYNQQFPFPFELKIENPRTLPLSLEITCNFEGKSGSSPVAGRIEGAPPRELVFRDAEFKSSYLCFPEGELKGKYKVWFNATIKDVVTVSKLQRAFVGDKSAEEINQLRREEISKVIKNPESLAPADFVHINFDLGHAAKEVVIEDKKYKIIVLKGNIENTGSGKIVAVQSYEIHLEAEGFSVQQNVVEGGNTCVRGSFPIVSSTLYVKAIALPPCTINDYPQELKPAQDKDWVPKTFTATLKYDYRITKDIDIDIKPAEGAAG